MRSVPTGLAGHASRPKPQDRQEGKKGSKG